MKTIEQINLVLERRISYLQEELEKNMKNHRAEFIGILIDELTQLQAFIEEYAEDGNSYEQLSDAGN